jgi:hypothetical protein
MVEIRDEFLSEEDLDRYTYSHGVFVTMTEPHEPEK